MRPTTTILVAPNSHPNQKSLQYRRSALIRSSIRLVSSGGNISPEVDSDDRRAHMLATFLKFLFVAGGVFLIVIVLCVWEFTIGIRKSIKKLYNVNITLYI